MSRHTHISENISELRARAEKRMEEKQLNNVDSSSSQQDLLRVIHELTVHQIELELQQEELIQSRGILEKSLERYTDLYDFAPLGYLTLARDSSILEANLTAAKMLGVERSRLKGKRLKHFFAPEDHPTFNVLMESVFIQGEPKYGDTALLNEIDLPFPANPEAGIANPRTVRIAAVICENGEACRAVLNDISQQKTIEMEMRIRNEHQKLIMDATQAGSWEWDLQTDTYIWSDELWRLFCLEPQTEGASFDKWKQSIIPEDRADTERAVVDAFERGVEFTIEWRVLDSSGQERWLMSKGTPFKKSDGKVYRYVGIVVDISELKRAKEIGKQEQLLSKTIIQSIPGTFYMIDANGFYASWNASQRDEIIGKPESEIADTLAISTIHPDDRELVLRKITNVFEKGFDENGEYVEGRVLVHGGPAFRWFLMTGRRIILDGNPFLIGIGIDITARKKIEDVQLFLSSTSYKIEEPFFNALARYLAEILEVDFVCVDSLEADGLTARTLVAWTDGRFEENKVYSLINTPCGDVIDKEVSCFPSGVRQLFPHNRILNDLQAESYVGVTLWDHTGRPIGLIAVIGRRPLVDRQLAEATLKIVSVRASGELERLKSELELRESEKKYRELFDSVPIGLYQATIDGKIITANKGCLDIARCKDSDRDAWLAQDTRKVYVHPEDRVRLWEILLKQGYVNGFEADYYRMDGTVASLSNTAKIVRNEKGEVEFVTGSFIDITERKLVEEELTKLSIAVQQSPAVVVITDPLGNIEYINPTFTLHTGYTLEEVRGQNPRILQSGMMPKEVYEEFWQTILSGKVWHGEFHNKKKNGELFWEDAVISAIRNKEGVITNFIAVKEDITEKKKLWSELIDAKEKAEESDRLKTAFLANISHEIRTPMNGILGFSELLKEPLSREAQAEYIDLINQSGQRMLSLINDLIDISRIEAGDTMLQLTRTNVNSLLLDLCAFFNPIAEQKGLSLSSTTGLSDNESIIETDRIKLNQILTNLIHNALKFTTEGSVHFGYTRKNDLLEFYVVDTGIGIPTEMKENIFERFRQVDNSITRIHEGSGLGLSISKAYVEMLGGAIRVQSVQGRGSEFFFTLPYRPPVSSKQSLFSADSDVASFEGTLKDITVLIADDDEVSRMLLKMSLKNENITIITAENGREAVELAERHPEIDLVLMDIKMPEMNGFDATRHIKQFRPGLPVIAQTAFTSKADKEKAADAGCDGFITKPISKKDLLALMKDLLSR